MALNDRSPPAAGQLPLLIRRWLPVAAFAALATGIGLHVAGSSAGLWLVMLAMLTVCLQATFILAREGKRTPPFDERELVQHHRAGQMGTLAVAAGALLLVASGRFGLWAPRTPDDWQMLLSALLTLLFGASRLYSAWALRPLDEED